VRYGQFRVVGEMEAIQKRQRWHDEEHNGKYDEQTILAIRAV
jgi:hypothetical protein